MSATLLFESGGVLGGAKAFENSVNEVLGQLNRLRSLTDQMAQVWVGASRDKFLEAQAGWDSAQKRLASAGSEVAAAMRKSNALMINAEAANLQRIARRQYQYGA